MSELGFKSMVYYKNNRLGEVETLPIQGTNFKFPNNEIRIHHLSPHSNRCIPHSVIHTISSSSILCRLESPNMHSELYYLYMSCIRELKTGVVLLGGEEVHLVAMVSKYSNCACFWCYTVPSGLYSVCLQMLDLRCLWIVFDLDETLIVANTMKSFRDKIGNLRSRIARETDPVRKLGMSAEMVLYEEDRRLLKQYIDSDTVVDNGNVYKVQAEKVIKTCASQERLIRPVIRLLDRSIVLTRINPEIRDTSVLVRLRPAWEDLRRHLNSKERKRFEVYVCTMAERNYALEMWRLLDPGAHLIDPNQLSARVVCVKSGARKSLLSVFRDQKFHPEMAMVIDDRLEVWEDVDQPRVQVVPAFTPYCAPQAETANGVPVLCVARNVVCNVRGCFFKQYDDNLSRRVSELFYEDHFKDLPLPPDVRTHLISEGGWLVDVSRGYISNQLSATVQGCNLSGPDIQHTRQNSLGHSNVRPVNVGSSSHVMESKSKEARHRYKSERQNLPAVSHPSGTGNQFPLDSSVSQDGGKEKLLRPSVYVEKLQEIGKRCHLEVEYKSFGGTSENLQFSAEVLFGGEKVGTGRGMTKKDAQQKAAENALRNLADSYVAYTSFNSEAINPELN